MASVTFKSFCRLPESSSQPGSHCEPGLPPVFPRTENGVPALRGKTLTPRIQMLPCPPLPLLILSQGLPLLLPELLWNLFLSFSIAATGSASLSSSSSSVDTLHPSF